MIGLGARLRIRRQAKAETEALAKYSDWANSMHRKVAGTLVLLWDGEKADGILLTAWMEIRRMAEAISINLFEAINNECPKIKEDVDKLVAADRYDFERAQMGIIAFAIASFWVVGESVDKKITKNGLRNLISCLKYDSNLAEKMLSEITYFHAGIKHAIYGTGNPKGSFEDRLISAVIGVKKISPQEFLKYGWEISMTLVTSVGTIGVHIMDRTRIDNESIRLRGEMMGLEEPSLFKYLDID